MNESLKDEKSSSECKRILFLDDEERFLRALRSIFRGQYEVFTTTSADLAIEQLKQQHYHLVVSDQNMPETIGTEFLCKVKEISPTTMRILLTGNSDIKTVICAINDCEVFRYINKPWDTDWFYGIINEAVEMGVKLDKAEEPVKVSYIPASKQSVAHSILTVSRAKALHKEIKDLAQDKCEVLYAKNPNDAFQAIRDNGIAVIVAEADPGNYEISDFLKQLKKVHPEIVSILITPMAEPETAIDLINQAQLFRFLTMPVSKANLKSNIDAALNQSSTLVNSVSVFPAALTK